jgi:hypothetical protein
VDVETVTNNSVHSAGERHDHHTIHDEDVVTHHSCQSGMHNVRANLSFQQQIVQEAAIQQSLGDILVTAPLDVHYSPSLSHWSVINHGDAQDPDPPFQPVSIPATLFPTPEPTHVSSDDDALWQLALTLQKQE